MSVFPEIVQKLDQCRSKHDAASHLLLKLSCRELWDLEPLKTLSNDEQQLAREVFISLRKRIDEFLGEPAEDCDDASDEAIEEPADDSPKERLALYQRLELLQTLLGRVDPSNVLTDFRKCVAMVEDVKTSTATAQRRGSSASIMNVTSSSRAVRLS